MISKYMNTSTASYTRARQLMKPSIESRYNKRFINNSFMNETQSTMMRGSVNSIARVLKSATKTKDNNKYTNSFKAEVEYESDKEIEVASASIKVSKIYHDEQNTNQNKAQEKLYHSKLAKETDDSKKKQIKQKLVSFTNKKDYKSNRISMHGNRRDYELTSITPNNLQLQNSSRK